ncbi:hypothetical protein R5R35_004712 [Gryllus longicercus]|uniref:Peptidase S1 domain-containing protein n=1 Tax=Gryllus longicercus TaxID=2509291 RepID=A0AAN9VCE1_9ORTH
MASRTFSALLLALLAACATAAPSERKEVCAKYGEAVWKNVTTFGLPKQTYRVDLCRLRDTPLVTGGEQAKKSEFPHMALLGYGEYAQQNLEDMEEASPWQCGGSLISDRFVLTAAHCVVPEAPRWVRVGELVVGSTRDSPHEDVAVAQALPHPGYRRPRLYHDIALLRLARPLAFSEGVRPACLYVRRPAPATKAVATGWGATDRFNVLEKSRELMKVVFPIHDTEVCQKTYPPDEKQPEGFLGESMVCAGSLKSDKDTCKGDSGGPLQVRLEQPYCMYGLVGLTSFGKHCGSKNPSVYTRVAHYVPWIESVVWPEER